MKKRTTDHRGLEAVSKPLGTGRRQAVEYFGTGKTRPTSRPCYTRCAAIQVLKLLLMTFVLLSVWAASMRAAETEPAIDRELEIVRERILASLQSEPDPERIRELLDSLRPDGSWPDVDYQSKRRSHWETSQHLKKLLHLASAHTSRGAALRDDPRLKNAVSASLDYWLTNDFRNSNWWHNRIGVPRSLSRILLLLDEELTEAQRNKGIKILKRADLGMTGQNLVWLAEIVASRGILQRDVDLVDTAYQHLKKEIRVSTKEGIQPDNSFHQHGPCLYSHGYGAAFASDCSQVAVRLAGTRFAFSPQEIELLARLILDGHQWLARGGTPDYGAIGRQTARTNQSVAYLASVARNMSQLPTGREPEFKAMGLRAAGQPAPPLVGNRHFWQSDTMVHHRPVYFTSARMFSSRIVNTDGPANGEGLRNHHIADGCNLILRTGREYWNIFPVWDWEKVPGTTVELTDDFSGSPRSKGETDFVGGVSDGLYGVAAFDLRRKKLAARKAWFFLDEQYVCLGAGINCDSANPVVTTVNQCHLEGNVIVSDGGPPEKLGARSRVLATPSWVYHDQVAYVFPYPATVHVRKQRQAGSWHLIASERPDTPVSEDVFSLWIEHGTNPANANYAYVVAPGIPLSKDLATTAMEDVEILRNDHQLQCVRHGPLLLTGAAFYEPGSIEITADLAVSVDQACLLLLREAPGEIVVTLSNPRNEPLRVAVGITVSGVKLSTLLELPGGMDAGKSIVHVIPIGQPN